MKLYLSYVLLSVICIGYAIAGTTNCECGKRNKERIVGGKSTLQNEYPFMVGILNATNIHYCGGSIVTPYHIVTAAHCLDPRKSDLENVIVAVGAHDLLNFSDNSQRKYEAEKVIIHEDYAPFPKLHNDIAIIVTKEPIQYSKYVSPICFPDKYIATGDLIDVKLTTMGWGDIMNDDDTTERLKNLKHLESLTAVPYKECIKSWPEQNILENSQICAHLDSSNDVCMGDSGGPLTFVDPDINGFTLVGTVSFGPSPCGATPMPSVYANASFYRDWLLSHINAKGGVEVCSKQ